MLNHDDQQQNLRSKGQEGTGWNFQFTFMLSTLSASLLSFMTCFTDRILAMSMCLIYSFPSRFLLHFSHPPLFRLTCVQIWIYETGRLYIGYRRDTKRKIHFANGPEKILMLERVECQSEWMDSRKIRIYINRWARGNFLLLSSCKEHSEPEAWWFFLFQKFLTRPQQQQPCDRMQKKPSNGRENSVQFSRHNGVNWKVNNNSVEERQSDCDN